MKIILAYFKFENKAVFYEEIGSGDPLLLLHGNTASSKMFSSILEMYLTDFKIILIDFSGHGKSERVIKFKHDFWYYNSNVCYALLEHIKIDKLSVVGTSGGALVGINLALEHPEKVKYLIADSFMGEYPLNSYNTALKEERQKSKKNTFAKEFWTFNHGDDWENVIDLDTEMFINFSQSGSSFFNQAISELSVPTTLTGSKQDEFCNNLNNLYNNLKMKNNRLEVKMFETGNHPAILSNKDEFYSLIKKKFKNAT